MVSFNRSKFLEMCDGLLARVEAPLRSVLEQASKCVCVLCFLCRKMMFLVQTTLAADRT